MPLLSWFDENEKGNSSVLKETVWFLLVFIIYFIAVKTGLLVVAQPEGMAPIWPASGIALSALLLRKQHSWPVTLSAIFLSNTIGNLLGGNSLMVSLGFAFGNTLEPALGGWVFAYFTGYPVTFKNISAIKTLFAVALLCNALTAFIGAITPTLAFGASYFDVWRVWWIGDGLGIIILTPFIISWINAKNSLQKWSAQQIIEVILFIIAIAAIAGIIFGYKYHLPDNFLISYIIYPIILYSSFRYQMAGSSLTLLTFSIIIITSYFLGTEAHILTTPTEMILAMQAFIFISALTGLSVTAALSERNEKDQILKDSEEKYRKIIQTAIDGFWLIGTSGKLLQVNDSYCKMSGYTNDELLSMHVTDLEAIESKEEIADKIINIMDKGVIRFETKHRRKDGSIFDVEISVQYHSQKEKGLVCFLRDITKLKQAEENLKVEQDFIKRIMETSPVGITRVNPSGQVIYANKRAEVILGITLTDNNKRTYNDPAWRISDFEGNPLPDEALPFNIAKDTGRPAYDVQHAIMYPDGKRILLSINATPLLNPVGKFDGIVASVDDITEKYTASHDYQMLFHQMIDGFALHEIIRDAKGRPVDYRFLAVNPAFERLTLLKAEAITNKTVLEVMPDTERYWIETYGNVALTGVPTEFENYSQALDKYFHVTAFRPAPNQFACIFSDITERKKLEAQLQQAQKMESIGTLAGGIAHDFNNILSPILLYSELTMEDMSPDDPLRTNINEIYRAGNRARDLVTQILTFARKRPEEPTLLKVSLIVKEAVKFMRSTIPTTIDIRYDNIAFQDTVMADPTQINQIIMNLCTNAAHAMKKNGGSIEITLDNQDIAPGESGRLMGLKPGQYLKMSVKDTGTGIDPAIINRIFEPYYTTKQPGEGTGLGLAIIHGIVKNYKGDITVKSEPGKGTIFDVYLPLKETEPVDTVVQKEVIPKGTENILFVDDEKPVVDAMQKMLEMLGYKVTASTSSLEALEIFNNSPYSHDMVITDMTMPDMTGKELAIKLRRLRADIPIILCTGFSDQIDEKEANTMGINAFLIKPVAKAQMAKTIREVLDK